MTKPPKQRAGKKQIERAAQIAKEHGVRVTVGKYVIDPPNAAPASNDADEIQRKLDAMAKR